MRGSIFPRGVAAISIVLGLLAPASARPSECAAGIAEVYSRIGAGYSRERLPDGSFRVEGYALADGGRFGAPAGGTTFDEMTRIVAAPLRAQNYIPAGDPGTERLIIVVHYGTTSLPESYSSSDGFLQYQDDAGDPARYAALLQAEHQLSRENMQREQAEYAGMTLLSRESEASAGSGLGDPAAGAGATGGHLASFVPEAAESRYFVILMAYDSKQYRRGNGLRLLWETRFSIDNPGRDIASVLPAAAQFASRYLGRDTHGLLRTEISRPPADVCTVRAGGDPTLPGQ